MNEAQLLEKLAKIEALFAGTTFDGEKAVAGEALVRMQERLEALRAEVPPVEMQFSMTDSYSKQLFMALLRRYGLSPYRYKRQKHTTVMVRVPERFVNETLWPEFQELSKVLHQHLKEITLKTIQTGIFADTSEADVVLELPE